MSQKNNLAYNKYIDFLSKIILQNKYFKSELDKKDREILYLKNKQKELVFELAHSLQIPLAVMKSELHIIKNREVKQKNISVFENNIEKLSNFINNIFKISKINNSENNNEKTTINLSELFMDLVESFEIISQEKNIKIISNIDHNIFFFCNKKDIIDLMNNLVSNSIKYISNERKIFLNLKRYGKRIFISVKDTGLGIAKDDLPLVFNNFFRTKENLVINGCGLGLFISKKIVEKYKGKIFIDSKEGLWTEILVIF
jgi:two-component system phosphate regulon sensor histidine kinase PhoR